jgi:hypothetical protein
VRVAESMSIRDKITISSIESSSSSEE